MDYIEFKAGVIFLITATIVAWFLVPVGVEAFLDLVDGIRALRRTRRIRKWRESRG